MDEKPMKYAECFFLVLSTGDTCFDLCTCCHGSRTRLSVYTLCYGTGEA